MKKYLFALALLLTACSAATEQPVDGTPTITPTSTPNAGEIALQMLQEKAAAEATSQIVAYQFTATAEVIGVTSTAQANWTMEAVTQQARADAMATSQQERKDAQATQARKDADATAEQAREDADNATAFAVVMAQKTADANATQTFTVMTLTAIPGDATNTAIAINNDIALGTMAVEKAAIDLQVAKDTQDLKWQLPLYGFVFASVIVLLWSLRESRWKTIKNDDGDVVGVGFHEQFIVPHLLPGAVLDLKAQSMPQLTDAETQKEIVLNDQKIRMIAALPADGGGGAAAAYKLVMGDKPAKRFTLLGDGDKPPASVLTPEAEAALEGDWNDG